VPFLGKFLISHSGSQLITNEILSSHVNISKYMLIGALATWLANTFIFIFTDLLLNMSKAFTLDSSCLNADAAPVSGAGANVNPGPSPLAP
jgi:hypothetical protein